MRKEQSYKIENYGKKPVFSSFLPGICGIRGIPIWCYYVNRGQGVVSFGIENKDKAIMEFYPAHTAYQNVKRTGFRTFIKKDGMLLEPFSDETIHHTMTIYKNSLEVTENNQAANLKTKVTYFALPEERVGALVRIVTIENTGTKETNLEILDGMPALIPYGVDGSSCTEMMQTAKAWMQAERTAEGTAYYRVRASMADSASVKTIEGGNFSLGYLEDGTRLETIVDPESIFGYDTSLQKPVTFIEGGIAAVNGFTQRYQNQVPCSFYSISKILGAGDRITLYELIGQVENREILSDFLKKYLSKQYLENKRERADELTGEIGDFMGGKTANPVFDEYSRYTFLDNVLRGGLPIKLGEDKVFYVYSRKHGDLERDYNFFSMLPEFYSQGNGNFRDVNQNRRNDNFFAPFVGDFNIKVFYSLLQPDGYNPLGVEKVTYRLEKENGEKWDFTPGSLYKELLDDSTLTQEVREEKFCQVMTKAQPLVNGNFGEGYWTDHWTYNLDLIENYLQIYPEKEEELLFDDSYTWFRPQAGVKERRQRYTVTENGIRQYDAIEEGMKAKEGCENDLLLCDDFGKGSVIHATLIEKLLLLDMTKFAALDAYGMGIEMEGGKPGWYDALNGLPGLLGSSVTELCELSRNLEFSLAMMKKYQKDVSLLQETAECFEKLADIAAKWKERMEPEGEKPEFWQEINDVKEEYRKKIYGGVCGNRRVLAASKVTETLAQWLSVVNIGIRKALQSGNGVCPAYFYYEVTDYTTDDGILPKHFRQHNLPLFLEGAVRYMKLPKSAEEKQTLYSNVRNSELFDKKLSMYKVNAPLAESSYELGRARAFTPGWLENESIWLHMEYKYLLELLKSGLYCEYFKDFKTMAVPFLNPEVYGRSIYENSSFLASSANPDPHTHGRGFVARLSGSTAEFIQMWTLMMFGTAPFVINKDGKLQMNLQPILPEYLIGENGCVEATFLGNIHVIYHFAEKRDYVPGTYQIRSVILRYADGKERIPADGCVCDDAAEDVRKKVVKEIEITIQ